MSAFKENIKSIIFGTTTIYGKWFDIVLIFSIIVSVFVVIIDSVSNYHNTYGEFLYVIEWIFTIFFTIEYSLRIYCIRLPSSYIFSFFGIIDLLAIIPTYLSLLFPGAIVFSTIRILRVLRIFRVLRLIQFMGEAEQLKKAMAASKRKIFVFLFYVMTLVVMLGSIMYLVEGENPGFDNIPRSIYWAIVTLTTVGYGDISPQTNLGQIIASMIMIMGYSIIAVPTGIVTSAMHFSENKKTMRCAICEDNNQKKGTKYCNNCGGKFLNDD